MDFAQLYMGLGGLHGVLLYQYSPVPRARSSTAGNDATRTAREQIYAGLGTWGGARAWVG